MSAELRSDPRALVRELVDQVVPLDAKEAKHCARMLDWIDSRAPSFRVSA